MADPREGFDVQAFLQGRCGDPAAWLGLFGLPGGTFVRTFQPGAARVELLRGDEAVAELRQAHPEGLFEGWFEGLHPFLHRFRCRREGQSWLAEDAYRFSSRPGELDRHLLGEGNHQRLYEVLGAHPACHEGVEGCAFAVWAPNAHRVSVVGDFNHWDGRRHILRPSPAGVWELFVPGARAGQLYKFEIHGADGTLLPLKTDPFAFALEHPPGSAARIQGLPRHDWGDQAWMGERWKRNRLDAPMSIYEVHLGSWMRGEGGRFLSYREMAARLVPYARGLGFTHLQLLPVMEHPYYGSWGYQPLGLFAPTARFGPPEDFAHFVDAAHQAGLGVILDWVPAHFPEDAWGLARFDGTCLFEHEDPRQGRHQDWGTLIYNFGRAEVRNFLLASALFWLDRYHVDGLRVDAVASMLYLDYSRRHDEWIPNRFGGRENLEAVDFLRRLNETVYERFPDTMTIAEESTAWPMVSRPVHLGGLGFGFKWDMGWMHDSLRYLARSMVHRRWHHDEITFGMLYHRAENFVLALSHDEVVHGKRSLLWRMPGSRWEQFANLRLLLAWMHLHGGKKLLFMGGEFGQDHEWDHQKGLDWHLAEYPEHAGVQRLVGDLNRLHARETALHELDGEEGGFRWLDCSDRRNAVLAVLRQGRDPEEQVVAVANFTAQPHLEYRLGVPRPGRWRELLNSDAEAYGGQGWGNFGACEAEPHPFHGQPHSLRLTLPPLAVVFLKTGRVEDPSGQEGS
ncbi:MAG: 1,4-alpha-glucan branching protein GlgB [Acidobacteria bacterium]|nr:1,4-alpha-glucan branching protein GlgB [Acidobacteriota bacterium]